MKQLTRSMRLTAGAVVIGTLCVPLLAAAEDSVPPGKDSADIFGTAVVASESLDRSRGGTDLILNDIKSDGVVRDNQASNLTTGNNWITEGSFAGASGFPTVVQNSGNNVLIQNSTIINLQVQ